MLAKSFVCHKMSKAKHTLSWKAIIAKLAMIYNRRLRTVFTRPFTARGVRDSYIAPLLSEFRTCHMGSRHPVQRLRLAQVAIQNTNNSLEGYGFTPRTHCVRQTSDETCQIMTLHWNKMLSALPGLNTATNSPNVQIPIDVCRSSGMIAARIPSPIDVDGHLGRWNRKSPMRRNPSYIW